MKSKNQNTNKENVDKTKNKLNNNDLKENIFNICFLIMFFILSCFTFHIDNSYFLSFVFTIIVLNYLYFKISFKDIIKFNFYSFLSFSLLITIINFILMGLHESINVLVKLTLVCNLCFILSNILPSYKLAKTVELILKPLHFLKIDINSTSLIISIGITFIPILINDIYKIRISLVSKGIKYNSIKNIYYIFKTLIPNLFKKINEIDYSLISKGFNE